MIKRIFALATLITALTPSVATALPNTDATRYANLQRAYINNGDLVSLVDSVGAHVFMADITQLRDGERKLLAHTQKLCQSPDKKTKSCDDAYRTVFELLQRNYSLYYRVLNMYR